jgi:hypothetical protein
MYSRSTLDRTGVRFAGKATNNCSAANLLTFFACLVEHAKLVQKKGSTRSRAKKDANCVNWVALSQQGQI